MCVDQLRPHEPSRTTVFTKSKNVPILSVSVAKSIILANFGVSTNFREVELEYYLTLIFEDENLSIGQRVKSRVRTTHKYK